MTNVMDTRKENSFPWTVTHLVSVAAGVVCAAVLGYRALQCVHHMYQEGSVWMTQQMSTTTSTVPAWWQMGAFGAISSYLLYSGKSALTAMVSPWLSVFRPSIVIRSSSSELEFRQVLAYITELMRQTPSIFTEMSLEAVANAGHNKDTMPFFYQPCDSDVHYTLWVEGVPIAVHRSRSNPNYMGHREEMIQLSTWGLSNRALKKFITDAMTANVSTRHCGVYEFKCTSSGGNWSKTNSLCKRTADSVILDRGARSMASHLLEDARVFLSRRAWYNEKRIPHRRGYLLHGPPGNGKTSLAQVLANELHYNICTMSILQDNMSDDIMKNAFRSAPTNGVILIEDIDAVTKEGRAATGKNNLTFSGILNAMDGVGAQEGQIMVFTTNHFDTLDPAIVRPGRCDVIVKLENAQRSQLVQSFLRFYPGEVERAEQFADRLPELVFSMAEVQNFFISCIDMTAEACLERTDALGRREFILPETSRHAEDTPDAATLGSV